MLRGKLFGGWLSSLIMVLVNTAGATPPDIVIKSAPSLAVRSGEAANTIAIGDNAIIIAKARIPLDDVIEASIRTGGSYVVIQDDKAQEDWANLMLYLSERDPDNLTEIPLPFGIQYYGLAKSGKPTPAFLITPPVSGVVIVSVDNKESFTPNIKVNGGGYQEFEGGLYKLSFNAQAGKKYRVTISDDLSDSGLYSIAAYIK
ncbi:MAG: hypothetical protein LBC09_03560 [Helicobacteraceae bacterium]|jgi:hypothetical protein|nr:hypothetical protein [Helicobacteraceae bacterium]